MIHVVTAANRHHYAHILQRMFELRRVHFVEGRGWSNLNVVNGAERDTFDDDRTVYYIALNEAGEIQCSMRGRPTDDRCMLTDNFQNLIHPDQPPLKGEDVWEISRIFTAPANRLTADDPPAWRTPDVLLASMEHAYDNGATRLVAVVDLANYGRMKAARINIRMVGLPHQEDTCTFVGVEVANTPEDIAAFRKAMGRTGRSGYEAEDDDFRAFGTIRQVEIEAERAARVRLIGNENELYAQELIDKALRSTAARRSA